MCPRVAWPREMLPGGIPPACLMPRGSRQGHLQKVIDPRAFPPVSGSRAAAT